MEGAACEGRGRAGEEGPVSGEQPCEEEQTGGELPDRGAAAAAAGVPDPDRGAGEAEGDHGGELQVPEGAVRGDPAEQGAGVPQPGQLHPEDVI